MIVIEMICGICKWIAYYVSRPVIWVVTARDCRHCKYGSWSIRSRWYYDPFGWYCRRNYHPDMVACQKTPWRCKFERRRKGE